MRKLLVLGAGTAGTMVVNHLRPRLATDEWAITVVDQDETHYYQPGFLFIPFGTYDRNDVVRPIETFVPDGVDLVEQTGNEVSNLAIGGDPRIVQVRWKALVHHGAHVP